MSIYILQSDSPEAIRRRILKNAPMLLLTTLPACIWLYSLNDTGPFRYVVMLLLVFIGIIIAVYYGTERKFQNRLIIENDLITFQQENRPDKTISRADIKCIGEIKDSGLIIYPVDSSNKIFVSKDFEDYEKLKSELHCWAPIYPQSNPLYRQIAYVIFIIALALAAFVFRFRLFLYAVIVLFFLFLIYEIVLSLRLPIRKIGYKTLISIILSTIIVVYIISILFFNHEK